jgi:hypothetical protein
MLLTCVDRPPTPKKQFPIAKKHICNHDVKLILDIRSRTDGNYSSNCSNCNEHLLNSLSKE